MDAEEIQVQVQGRGCNKFPRIGNGRKIGPPEEEEVDGCENRLRGWHGASRIIRVSRASGGKDRHSKVWTSKGLRDRRVRLSVTTAIQFYDLQDRLGYDQPSKAVEWLIKAAADSISELPALNPSFPETPNRPDSMEELAGGENENHHQAQINNSNNQNNQSQISMSKSSSTSETSKGSGLSLSRSEVRVNRVKASRERARERAKGGASNPIPQNSFTELLTAGAASASAPMDYFSSSGLLGQSSSSSSRMQAFHHHSIPVSPYNHHPDQLQQFSFVPDHYIPVVSSQGSDVYNLNFTISPSGGYSSNRGTLQSNSPSFLPHHHLQRYGDGSSNVPFFLAPGENNHHHQHLQQQHQHIFYGDSKEKEKN